MDRIDQAAISGLEQQIAALTARFDALNADRPPNEHQHPPEGAEIVGQLSAAVHVLIEAGIVSAGKFRTLSLSYQAALIESALAQAEADMVRLYGRPQG